MPIARFYRNVLRSDHDRRAFLSECLAFGSRLSHVSIGMSCVQITPAVCRMSAKQDGLRYVPFLFRRGSRSPIARSRIAGAIIRLGWFTSGLRVFCGDPDGIRKKRGDAENGVGGAAWVRFCVIILALRRFPRGVRWGEMWKPHCGRAPDCAKESSTLWTLFIWVVMWVRFTRGRRCGYNGELAGHSWIEGSACVCVTQPSSWPSRSLS